MVIIWGWILVSAMTQTLAFSLAEICSKYPTSAGAYYWCYKLASPRTRLLASWINGWLTVVGGLMIDLSVKFGTAQLVVAGAGIYYPEWNATALQTYVIFLGVTTVAGVFCIFCNRLLPTVDIMCACWTGLGIIVISICLLAEAAAGRRSVSFALGNFDPTSPGWTPGWSFFIGLLPPAYTLSAVGMITNMAEEVHNPSETLPKVIISSVPIGTLTGVVYLLPILFTLPDVGTMLRDSSQPIGLMFTLIMGSRAGGFGLWFISTSQLVSANLPSFLIPPSKYSVPECFVQSPHLAPVLVQHGHSHVTKPFHFIGTFPRSILTSKMSR